MTAAPNNYAAFGGRVGSALALAVLLAAPCFSAEPESRAHVRIPLGSHPVDQFNKPFQSWKRLQQQNVVMQQHDYSCGAAAVATMAQYYFGDDVAESKLLERRLNQLSAKERADREKNGFSMDDLFHMAKDAGYQATVYPLKPTQLKELQAPIIVRLVKDDFKHFVVYRGYTEDRVWIADPLRGNRRMSAEDFFAQWNGVALILGKSGFGLPKNHRLAVPQPEVFRPEIQAARRYLDPRP